MEGRSVGGGGKWAMRCHSGLVDDLHVALKSLYQYNMGRAGGDRPQLKDPECHKCLEKVVGQQEGMTEYGKGTVPQWEAQNNTL